MYQNVRILSTGTYQPKNRIENEFYVKHYGKGIEGLLNLVGRKYRFRSNDTSDTSISMGIEAGKQAIEKAKIEPEEIDMVVFVSDTPEYTTPSNAIKIHNSLGLKNANVVYDMNSNCVGMIVALDQVSRFMKTNKKVKKALIVSSVLISSVSREDDAFTYALFSDAAGAVILEKNEEEKERGFMASSYRTDSFQHNVAQMPWCGYSKIYNKQLEENDKKWMTTPFSSEYLPGVWIDLINELAEEMGFTPDNIDNYILSQFSKTLIIQTLEALKVSQNKYTFVSEEYGYAGVVSPILALQYSIEKNKFQEGSKIIISSIGTGYTTCALLYQF